MMKILVLSCSTGNGHNAAAKAVQERLAFEGHEAVLLDPYCLSSQKTADRVGNTYIQVASRVPRLFGFVYRVGSKISSPRHKSPVYYANIRTAKKLKNFLAENAFDGIVMTHLFPAEMVTYLKRAKCPIPPTVAVFTDYTCIPFWEETECDYYIIPHEQMIPELAERGLPAGKLLPYGIPVGMDFCAKADKARAREKLALPPDKPIFLVMSGSMGFGKMHLFVFELIRKLTNGEHLLIICGNNRKTRRILKSTYRRNPRVHVTGYTEHVADYMDACDVVFTKPGGLTSTEALVKNIPMVHTAAIPGCETRNREFFVSRGLSLASEHVHTQISQGITLVQNVRIRDAMKDTQKEYARPSASADIVRLLLRIRGEEQNKENDR